MNKTIRMALVSTLLPFTLMAADNDSLDNRNERISKQLDLFNIVYKNLELYYVDTINPEKAVRSGIDAMLETLDPYTTYIPEEDEAEFKMMISGEYAGVGASINKVDSVFTFMEIYEGTPSFKNGFKAGDQIIEIDGKKTEKMTSTDVSSKLRGESNTQVKLLVRNPITNKTRKVTVTRETISLPSIEYADTLGDGIGYIRFSSFTDNSAAQFKQAFLDLKAKGISSLIVDLRNNPGGLLDQASQIINYFIPNQSTIVYTKSKLKQLNEVYKATQQPIDKDIPMVILVNKNSASAAEIFSGSLQDLDRAVIVGERTFGKGLVQMTQSLPFGGNLKMTTSKYYIPSGRCVQAINYAERDEEGYVKRIPDSLTKVFHTANGRTVRDGCGVSPDVQMTTKSNSTIAYYLYTKNIIFNYAVQYIAKHPKLPQPKDFVYSEYADFKQFAKQHEFTYKLKTEEAIATLKEIAKAEGYLDHSQMEFDALEKKLSHNLDQDLDLFEKEISGLISSEIMKQVYYQKGGICQSLKTDLVKDEAVAILKDKERYQSILQPKKETK